MGVGEGHVCARLVYVNFVLGLHPKRTLLEHVCESQEKSGVSTKSLIYAALCDATLIKLMILLNYGVTHCIEVRIPDTLSPRRRRTATVAPKLPGAHALIFFRSKL